jgi:hypothetical protein
MVLATLKANIEIPVSMCHIVIAPFHTERIHLVEKQIVTVSYWLGLVSSLIALGMRLLAAFGLLPRLFLGPVVSYMSIYKGALLFLLIAIATASYASVRGEKT